MARKTGKNLFGFRASHIIFFGKTCGMAQRPCRRLAQRSVTKSSDGRVGTETAWLDGNKCGKRRNKEEERKIKEKV